LLGACASPQLAPRFEKPSLAPIRVEHQEIEKHAKKAKDVSKDIEKECPQAKALIDELNAEIDGLLQANSRAEGQIDQLDTQLTQQTEKANKLADNYDKQGVQLKAKDEAIKRRNKILAFLFIGNLACLAWIFRKPLLALVVA